MEVAGLPAELPPELPVAPAGLFATVELLELGA